MTDFIDILQRPSNKRVRKEINNICDSYSHPWDIAAELCQNAVDAINLFVRRNASITKPHRIDIVFDARDRSISVRDTGVGINPDELPGLLEPHSTNKDEDDKSIGEKGVGVTYTMFACNSYSISTQSTKGFTRGQLLGGSSWRRSGSNGEPPKFERLAVESGSRRPDDSFTEVKVVGVESSPDDSFDIFSLTDEQLEFTLRSKTALGCTAELFGRKPEASPSIFLERFDVNGRRSEKEIPFRHATPEDFLSTGDAIDMDTFKNWTAAQQPTDAQKRRKLKGKILRRRGFALIAGRKIEYYALYVSSRNFWGSGAKVLMLFHAAA